MKSENGLRSSTTPCPEIAFFQKTPILNQFKTNKFFSKYLNSLKKNIILFLNIQQKYQYSKYVLKRLDIARNGIEKFYYT